MESFCLGVIMAQIGVIGWHIMMLRHELAERHEEKSKKD